MSWDAEGQHGTWLASLLSGPEGTTGKYHWLQRVPTRMLSVAARALRCLCCWGNIQASGVCMALPFQRPSAWQEPKPWTLRCGAWTALTGKRTFRCVARCHGPPWFDCGCIAACSSAGSVKRLVTSCLVHLLITVPLCHRITPACMLCRAKQKCSGSITCSRA